ncbi:MAG: hypothetical protein D6689_06350 [Deltaproteobacteria bacterium]|nr:MAG: hypothetical protein D6689_06350 [Deltaproteobacteria bacterium]
MGKPWLTANRVTFARIAVMPLMVWLFYQGRAGRWWAFGVGAIIAMTDFVDGYLARKHGPTVLGALMDPIADKLFVAVIFLPLVHLGWLPADLVALIFVRELLVTALRTIYERRGVRLRTSYFAKVKTWVQMQAAATILFIGLVGDRTVVWIAVSASAAIVVAAIVAMWLARRRVWRGAVIMLAMTAALAATLLPASLRDTFWWITLGILAFTWGSGIDYVVGGVRQLRGTGAPAASDLVRIASAVAIPLAAVPALVAGGIPPALPIGVVCVELAVGGLDNLLAHHGAEGGALAWAARTGPAVALLAAALWAAHTARAGAITPLAAAALAASVAGGAREFWRGRRYYL